MYALAQPYHLPACPSSPSPNPPQYDPPTPQTWPSSPPPVTLQTRSLSESSRGSRCASPLPLGYPCAWTRAARTPSPSPPQTITRPIVRGLRYIGHAQWEEYDEEEDDAEGISADTDVMGDEDDNHEDDDVPIMQLARKLGLVHHSKPACTSMGTSNTHQAPCPPAPTVSTPLPCINAFPATPAPAVSKPLLPTNTFFSAPAPTPPEQPSQEAMVRASGTALDSITYYPATVSSFDPDKDKDSDHGYTPEKETPAPPLRGNHRGRKRRRRRQASDKALCMDYESAEDLDFKLDKCNGDVNDIDVNLARRRKSRCRMRKRRRNCITDTDDNECNEAPPGNGKETLKSKAGEEDEDKDEDDEEVVIVRRKRSSLRRSARSNKRRI